LCQVIPERTGHKGMFEKSATRTKGSNLGQGGDQNDGKIDGGGGLTTQGNNWVMQCLGKQTNRMRGVKKAEKVRGGKLGEKGAVGRRRNAEQDRVHWKHRPGDEPKTTRERKSLGKIGRRRTSGRHGRPA